MGNDLALRRKWTLRAHGRQVVFVKRPNERTSHVVMKALLWSLYLPDYADLSIETRLADRYEPDVASIGDRSDGGSLCTWSELTPRSQPMVLAPSRASLMMSACPACCAVAPITCSSTPRAPQRAPGTNQGAGGHRRAATRAGRASSLRAR